MEIVFFGEHNEGLTRLEIVRGEVCIAEPLCLTRVIPEYHRHCIDHVFRLASIPSHYIYIIIIIVIIIVIIVNYYYYCYYYYYYYYCYYY